MTILCWPAVAEAVSGQQTTCSMIATQIIIIMTILMMIILIMILISSTQVAHVDSAETSTGVIFLIVILSPNLDK